jgi:HD-like signal output (HDOD) protein
VHTSPAFLVKALDRLATAITLRILQKWQFSEDIIEVVSHWKSSKANHAGVGYVDFLRLAVVLSGSGGKHQDSIIESSLAKGIVDSMEQPTAEQYQEVYHYYKAMFS